MIFWRVSWSSMFAVPSVLGQPGVLIGELSKNIESRGVQVGKRLDPDAHPCAIE